MKLWKIGDKCFRNDSTTQSDFVLPGICFTLWKVQWAALCQKMLHTPELRHQTTLSWETRPLASRFPLVGATHQALMDLLRPGWFIKTDSPPKVRLLCTVSPTQVHFCVIKATHGPTINRLTHLDLLLRNWVTGSAWCGFNYYMCEVFAFSKSILSTLFIYCWQLSLIDHSQPNHWTGTLCAWVTWINRKYQAWSLHWFADIGTCAIDHCNPRW